MNTRKMSVILAAVLAAAVSPVFANPEGGKGGERGEKKEWKQKLGLSDDQQKKFEDAHKAHEAAEKPLEEKIHAQFEMLGKQLKDEKTSDADIQASLDAIKAAHQSLESAQQKFHDDVAAFLTPRQRAKRLMGMMHHRMGHGEHGKMEGKNETHGGDKDEEDDD